MLFLHLLRASPTTDQLDILPMYRSSNIKLSLLPQTQVWVDLLGNSPFFSKFPLQPQTEFDGLNGVHLTDLLVRSLRRTPF
jgi:hypothetical protein